MSNANPVIAINESKVARGPDRYKTMALGRARVDYELGQAHNDGVLRHLDHGPCCMVFAPVMEQGLWRRHRAK
jgi:hypothetical protein